MPTFEIKALRKKGHDITSFVLIDLISIRFIKGKL